MKEDLALDLPFLNPEVDSCYGVCVLLLIFERYDTVTKLVVPLFHMLRRISIAVRTSVSKNCKLRDAKLKCNDASEANARICVGMLNTSKSEKGVPAMISGVESCNNQILTPRYRNLDVWRVGPILMESFELEHFSAKLPPSPENPRTDSRM